MYSQETMVHHVVVGYIGIRREEERVRRRREGGYIEDTGSIH